MASPSHPACLPTSRWPIIPSWMLDWAHEPKSGPGMPGPAEGVTGDGAAGAAGDGMGGDADAAAPRAVRGARTSADGRGGAGDLRAHRPRSALAFGRDPAPRVGRAQRGDLMPNSVLSHLPSPPHHQLVRQRHIL